VDWRYAFAASSCKRLWLISPAPLAQLIINITQTLPLSIVLEPCDSAPLSVLSILAEIIPPFLSCTADRLSCSSALTQLTELRAKVSRQEAELKRYKEDERDNKRRRKGTRQDSGDGYSQSQSQSQGAESPNKVPGREFAFRRFFVPILTFLPSCPQKRSVECFVLETLDTLATLSVPVASSRTTASTPLTASEPPFPFLPISFPFRFSLDSFPILSCRCTLPLAALQPHSRSLSLLRAAEITTEKNA
jgi:hypothetical protein